jgi:hypothetical protein
MGANAQTTVPTFTAGDVLTAAQMNQSARTGVPVFADTTARDAAFGGTGEKTLAEGQLCYVENLTGVAQIQYYDGSNWTSLSAGGLVLISTTTATSGGTVNVTNAFSSTYNSYMIVIDNMLYNTGGQTLSMTLGATSTGYYYGGITIGYTTGTVTGSNGNNTSSWLLGQGDNTNRGGAIVYLTNPNLAATTGYTSLGVDPRTAESTKFYQGFVNNTTQYTDFTISAATRTFASVSIKVYGYAQ